MREELHEMSVDKRKVMYQKRMKEYEWTGICLSVLIIIAGVLAARQFILLDVPAEMLPIAKKGIVYLVAMMTLAGCQLAIRVGQHVFKTTPWMIEFSQDNNKDITEKKGENESSEK